MNLDSRTDDHVTSPSLFDATGMRYRLLVIALQVILEMRRKQCNLETRDTPLNISPRSQSVYHGRLTPTSIGPEVGPLTEGSLLDSNCEEVT